MNTMNGRIRTSTGVEDRNSKTSRAERSSRHRRGFIDAKNLTDVIFRSPENVGLAHS